MVQRQRSQRPFVEEVPILVEQRGLSLRALARAAEVDPSHLHRVLREQEYKRASAEMAARVAKALGLPEDYFPEFRERRLIERVRNDPQLRDRLIDQTS